MMQSWTTDIDSAFDNNWLGDPADEIVESWAFIYVRPAVQPDVDRVVIERNGVRTTLVGVPDQSAAIQAAADLVAGGVQVIELCGILGPVWAARVIEATGGRVPVGAVSYGAESVAMFLNWCPGDTEGLPRRDRSGWNVSI
jgi:Family of unknown function (DUF6506)